MEFAYNNTVDQATGLARNEMHIGRLPHIPFSVFDLLASRDTKGWTVVNWSTATLP